MASLPKISLGISKKKSYFNLSHDVHTTSDVGFCQPTFIREMIPNSSINVKNKVFTRLAPLPVPTAGRLSYKQYSGFVPMRDVFEAFDYMQAQMTVDNALNSYVPFTADYVDNKLLFEIIAHISLQRIEKLDLGKYNELPFFNFTLLTPSLDDDNLVDNNNSITYKDASLVPLSVNDMGKFNGVITGLITALNDTSITSEDYLYKLIFNWVSSYGNRISEGDFNNFPELPTHTSHSYNWFARSLSDIKDWVSVQNPLYIANYRNRGDIVHSDFVFNCFDLTAHTPSTTKFIKVHYTGSDSQTKTINSLPVYLGINLTKKGQRLFKILTACGVDFKYNTNVELTKLFAYYKLWFDYMNPGRTSQWRETACYKLIHMFYDSNKICSDCFDGGISEGGCTVSASDYISIFTQFLDDLSACCYNLATDNITAIYDSPYPVSLQGQGNNNILNVDSLTVFSGGKNIHNLANTITSDNSAPVGYSPANDGGVVLKTMLRLVALAGKNSVIGSKINDYLKVHFGYTEGQSNLLGEDHFQISIDDVFSTADTDNAYLAEYAGKGIGSKGIGEDKPFSSQFEAKEFGYFIQFAVIVPSGGYVQASQRPHLSRLEFYQSEFDSITMVPVRKSEVLNRDYLNPCVSRQDGSFGYLPLFFDYKIKNNMHNGDFARHSTRQSYSPYNLDRIFSETEFTLDGVKFDAENLVPDEKLRSIGLYEGYGNYNRIFYDITGASDGFINHIVYDIDYYAPMLPIEQSFMTFEEETDDSSVNVQHS